VVEIVGIWHTGSVGRRGGDRCCKRKVGEQPIENENLSFVVTLSGRKVHTQKITHKVNAGWALKMHHSKSTA
jgi:hypothetical protein